MEQQYFLVQNGDVFEKYLITYDKLELIQLKKELIEKCSTIYHQTAALTFSPLEYHFINGENRNVVELDEKSIPSKNIYFPEVHQYSYDFYEYPKLVTIIDNILNGNIQSLLYAKFEEKVDYEKLIAYKNEKINNLVTDNTQERNQMLKELDKLIILADYNKNQRGTLYYKERFEKIFAKELVDTIKVTDVKHTLEFFNADKSKLDLHFHKATKDTLYYEPRKRTIN